MNRIHANNIELMTLAATSTILSVAAILLHTPRLLKVSTCESKLVSSSNFTSTNNSSKVHRKDGNNDTIENKQISNNFKQFLSHSYSPQYSMRRDMMANDSSVRGFRVNDIEAGVCVAQNMRYYQEDRWIILGRQDKKLEFLSSLTNWLFVREKKTPLTRNNSSTSLPISSKDDMTIFAVFDGHGGEECANFATSNFQSAFENELRYINTNGDDSSNKCDTTRILENTLIELDRSFIFHQRKESGTPQNAINSRNHGGSTAIIVAINHQKNEIVCSNIGDSRAILIQRNINYNDTNQAQDQHQNIIALSSDHSPDLRPDEVKRIQKLGGEVRLDTLENAFASSFGIKITPRVFHKNGVGGLNMTRALGDDYLKPLVIPDPETTKVQVPREGDLFIVVASDGIWDSMTNDEVSKLVVNVYDNHKVEFDNTELMKKCALKVVQEAQNKGSQDNITCMVLKVPQNEKK